MVLTHAKRMYTVVGILLTLILTFSFLGVSAPRAYAADACTLSPANWKSSLLALAGPSTPGWIAGDGFASAQLNANQTLFINQDTFVGTYSGVSMTSGSMPHNTALVYDKTNPRCWTLLNGTTTAGLFPTGGNPDSDYYWPAQPAVSGNVVAIPMPRMGPIPGSTATTFNFQQNATDLKTFTWNGSQLVPRSTRTFGTVTANPPGAMLGWSNNLSKDGWTYLVGNHMRSGAFGHDIYLARVLTTEFFAATSNPLGPNMQYLTNTGWKTGASYSELKKIYDASSDAVVSLIWSGEEYHFVTKEFSFLGTNIVDMHGPNIEGPYDRHALGAPPVKADTWNYGAQVHPEIGHTGWTYNVSVKYNNAVANEGWAALYHMDRYRPELATYILPETARIHTGMPNSLVFGNLTVTQARGRGYLTAYPCNEAKPFTSNLNYDGTQNLANFAAVKTDQNGDFCVYTTTPTHIIFDQISKTIPATPHTPSRKLDTRLGSTGKAPATTVTVVNTGTPNSLVFGNLTVTETEGPGHLRAYPCDQEMPLASNLNYAAGQTLANFSAIRTDADGNFCVYTTNTTHIIYDQVAETNQILGHTPVRKTDTRVNPGALAQAGSVTTVSTGTPNSLVFGNLTVTQAQGPGYLTAYSCKETRPLASNLNYVAGQTLANFSAIKTDADGNFCVYTATSATHIIYDQSAEYSLGTGTSVGTQDITTTVVRKIDTRVNNGN